MTTIDLINEAIRCGHKVKILYSKFDGELSERILSDLKFSVDVLDSEHIQQFELTKEHVTGYCHLRQEQRTFNINRIISVIKID
jgi:predicted DNA-binding transcriptional regulator YafY